MSCNETGERLHSCEEQKNQKAWAVGVRAPVLPSLVELSFLYCPFSLAIEGVSSLLFKEQFCVLVSVSDTLGSLWVGCPYHTAHLSVNMVLSLFIQRWESTSSWFSSLLQQPASLASLSFLQSNPPPALTTSPFSPLLKFLI